MIEVIGSINFWKAFQVWKTEFSHGIDGSIIENTSVEDTFI